MAYAYRIHDQHGVYFITCTVTQWADVFTRQQYADIVVDSLKYCQQHKALEVFAWVIMSNHIHLIISAGGGHGLSDILRDFKKFTSSRIVTAIEQEQQESRKSWLVWLLKQNKEITFWQPDNHAKEINSTSFFLEKLNYIHQNPVRAGLVDREEAWQYSSARDFHGLKGMIELANYH